MTGVMQGTLIIGINTILNGFLIFLNKVECCKFGNINIIKYTNILKIDSSDGDQWVNVTLNGIITGNTYIIDVELIFRLLLLYCPKQLFVVLIHCFKLITMSEEYEFESVNCYCDNIITGLEVRTADKVEEASKSETIGDSFVIVLKMKEKEKRIDKQFAFSIAMIEHTYSTCTCKNIVICCFAMLFCCKSFCIFVLLRYFFCLVFSVESLGFCIFAKVVYCFWSVIFVLNCFIVFFVLFGCEV